MRKRNEMSAKELEALQLNEIKKTANWGYELGGEVFIVGYCGVAGEYWNEGDNYSICRPW